MKKKIFLVLLSSTFVFAQSVTKTIKLLPDTGQNTSYTSVFGEDNDYNINIPSFTNNNSGTITDNITGLMWQQTDGGEMTIANAIIYADNLVLGGFSDWRLPSPLESFSILNHQNSNPAVNTTFFTANLAEYWWTNTFELNSTTKVWCTNAGGGVGNHPISETISAGGTKKFHARCVRDVAPTTIITNHFTDNSDGTITDNLTQLVWQKVPNANIFSWENALAFAENLTIGTNSDWRLPNIKELQSLNDESRTNPSVNTTFFAGIGVKNYWSSTSLPNVSTKAWYWNTIFGVTTYDIKTNTNYAICVRGNPTTLAVNDVTKSKKTIYPNPFSSTIKIENAVDNDTYKLWNENGQLLFSGKNIEYQNFSSLYVGVYFLEINGDSASKHKILKQ